MKKVTYIILSLLLSITSCSLEKYPKGAINTGDAIQSMEDIAKLRNYLYIRLRGLYAGSYIYSMEVSTDAFHPSMNYGNRGGDMFRWEWTPDYNVAQGLWQHCYTSTANANFLLEGIEKFETANAAELSDADKAQLQIYKGECRFVKAITMYVLAERFCSVYDPAKADTQLGVMIVDKYNPSSNPATYPGRSSLADTYTFIQANLTEAEKALQSVPGQEGSIYLTIDAVTALKARIALARGDFDSAISASTSLVDGGKYPLLNNTGDFEKMWTNDSGKECIVQLYADYAKESLPSTCQYNYMGEAADGTFSPDYIPEQGIIDLYDHNDIRWNTWFQKEMLTYGQIKGEAYICSKYPGNPALQDPSAKKSEYINKIKLFRIAEQYLIAAEAYARKGNNDGAACRYLGLLQGKRLAGAEEPSLTGDALLKEIKAERQRELFAEGFRFTDLKRWKEGFTRTAPQNKDIINNNGSQMSISADNYKYLWPIPQTEIDSNPQIKKQQNPGYNN